MKRTNFLFLFLALFLAQSLVVPKYRGNPEGALIGEYYGNRGGNAVVFIGDCEVYENFSPVTLWEEYGIPSVIRGSPQQLIWQSYYLLEEMLQWEQPEVVVFNVLALKYDTPESTGSQQKREAYNRMTLDGMRWSAGKWQAISESMTREERQWGGHLSYVFPLLRFHDRWQELEWEDFGFSREPVSYHGYLMQTGIQPVIGDFPEPPPADWHFGENSLYWLDRITQLCSRRDIRLILVKAPSLSPAWWPEWEWQVEEYALAHDLTYYNFLECQEKIGLDWTQDTYDGGLHLNVSGAEKLTRYFGSLLQLPSQKENPALVKHWEEVKMRYEEERLGEG